MNRRQAITALLSTTLMPAAAWGRGFDEVFRPQVHFSPAKNWTNDPNGLIWHKGQYHLFFQHNPFGDKWGHMSWGHAVSPDLFHWQELPVALAEEGDTMIFSGSVVSDAGNTSGFGTAQNPPLVAIYTAHHPKTGLQNQHIAFSLDDGLSWTKFAGNPVLDLDLKEFRDPKVIRYADHWAMVVARADERKVSFYASDDLKHWTLTGTFGPAGVVDGVWECPDLMELPIADEPGRTGWALKVDASPIKPGSGCGGQAFIGHFDGKTFTAESDARPVDFGEDYYASASWAGLPRGRAIAIGWMANPRYAGDAPTSPWRGSMSVPRELSLKRAGAPVLLQTPVRELAALESARAPAKPGVLFQAAPHDPARRIRLHVKPGGSFALAFRAGAAPILTIAGDGHRLKVARHAPASIPTFVSENSVPAAVSHLDIIVDRSSVEVFADDGERTFSDLIFPDGGGFEVVLSGDIVSADIATLSPIRN